MKPDIVVLVPYPAPILAQLDESFTVHRLWEATDKAAFMAKVAPIARAIGTSGGRGADAALMDSFPKAEMIACFGVGVDAIDLEAAKVRKLPVTNTPDVLTNDVADLAIALMLASARLVVKADRFVREGKWLQGGLHLGTKISGSTVGVVGLGRIGLAIAQRAAAFETTVVYSGPREKKGVPYKYYSSVKDMAADCDFLIAACPGGADTFHIIDQAALEALGPKGTVVNIARGSVIDEKAMIAALQSGKLGAAALDVFEDEPRVPAELIAMENVVLQPHQGSATAETRAAMGQLVVDNLRAHFAGKPLLTQV